MDARGVTLLMSSNPAIRKPHQRGIGYKWNPSIMHPSATPSSHNGASVHFPWSRYLYNKLTFSPRNFCNTVLRNENKNARNNDSEKTHIRKNKNF
jgi:hypothetical protein